MTTARMIFALLAPSSLATLAAPVALANPRAPATAPDPVRGGKLFLQCRACHTATAGGANTVGPSLAGVVGARAATRPGYSYSQALTKSGIVWTVPALDGFLTHPSRAVPGTKMIFAGMAEAKARADVIAYLQTRNAGKGSQ